MRMCGTGRILYDVIIVPLTVWMFMDGFGVDRV